MQAGSLWVHTRRGRGLPHCTPDHKVHAALYSTVELGTTPIKIYNWTELLKRRRWDPSGIGAVEVAATRRGFRAAVGQNSRKRLSTGRRMPKMAPKCPFDPSPRVGYHF